MAKGANQKQKLLVLERILRRETDEDHALTVEQLIERLEQNGISAERKSIYDDMETLQLCGLDVEVIRQGRANAYYLAEREFQLPELRLLVDAVQSSRFITEKKSLELIRKLESLTSKHQAGELQRQVHVLSRVKSMNESVYYTIDDLHRAIQQGKQIAFQYFDYDVDKKKVLRKDGEEYVVSPWALLWDNENYYLTAHPPGWRRLYHFRVDKITGLRILEAPVVGRELFESTDLGLYARQHFGMFNGRRRDVRLWFSPRMASVVMDRFGKEVTFHKQPDGFTITVEVDLSPQFYAWIFGLEGYAKILGPEEAVRGMQDMLKKVTAAHTGESSCS